MFSPNGISITKIKNETQNEPIDENPNFEKICYINIKEQNESDLSHIINKETKKKIQNLIENYTPTNLNKCPVEMEIILSDEIPISMKPRRMPPSERNEIEKQIEEWLRNDIIQHSYSDFSAQIVPVNKKDGTKRLCIDYRRLNKKIIKDRFPMPLIEDQIDSLEKGKVFSTLDLANGFFHVPMKAESRKYTSFVTHSGQYEFKVVPFGICNSPAIFCRFINFIFRSLRFVLTYMDDLIIVASNETEAIERLEIVLNLAASYNLSIKWKKCSFLKTRIDFLGYEIENCTVRPSEAKTKDIHKYREPRNVKEVQRFLGFTGYFRKFIENYAFIAKPLSDLTRNNTTFVFNDEQRKSFNALKEKVTQRPVLNIFRKDAETELHTDASKSGTAAILMQRSPDDNEFHPIHYLSRKNTAEQEKWFSYELELYAIFVAVEKFRHYLLDIHFKIVTDCEALKTAKNKRNVRKVACWLLELESYDYEIIHRPGTKMQHVDALSRMYFIESPSILHNIQRAQETDEHIKSIREVLKEKQYEDYVVHNKLLCKFANSTYQIVVPEEMQIGLINKAHQQGHFKKTKLEKLINREFFIPNLQDKINRVVSNCVPCILVDKKAGKREGFLHPIPKEPIPLDTFHIDHLGPMPSTNKEYNHILAIIDAFTKFVWLFPVKSTTANETINKLKVVTTIFGSPRRLITDRGTAFTANIFKEFCEKENIELIHITTGVPRSNGQIERIHRIVIGCLAKLSINEPEKWYSFTNEVQKHLNSTYQRAIKTTPFELMFGVPMKNQLNEITEIIEEEIRNDFNNDREQLRIQARDAIDAIQRENKKTFNVNRKQAHQYHIDDLVAISKTQFATGAKLKTKNAGPYKVTRAKGNDRYDVEKVGTHDGPSKTNTSADNVKPWPMIYMMKRIIPCFSNKTIEAEACVKTRKSSALQFFMRFSKNETFYNDYSTTKTILIEGNVGAGKSSLLNSLKQLPNIEVFPEPVNRWQNLNGHNLLNLMYTNPENNAFPMQSYAAITMIENHLKTTNKEIKIMERSILSIKHCYLELHRLNNTITPSSLEVLSEWIHFLCEKFPLQFDHIIYLRTNPDCLIERIKTRNRNEEKNISIEYLTKIHELHEKWLNNQDIKNKVFIINGELTQSECEAEAKKFISSF